MIPSPRDWPCSDGVCDGRFHHCVEGRDGQGQVVERRRLNPFEDAAAVVARLPEGVVGNVAVEPCPVWLPAWVHPSRRAAQRAEEAEAKREAKRAAAAGVGVVAQSLLEQDDRPLGRPYRDD